jgi:hypothetical protein
MMKRACALAVLALAAGLTEYALAGAPSTGMGMGMGPMGRLTVASFKGYYDGHKDTFLSTDVSSRTVAKAERINFSARIGKVTGLPEIYLVEGRAAAGQLPVFGSQPGEPDYSPLWDETILSWKAGSTPVLITSDNQIDKLEKTSGLSERDGHAVLNCPIVKVG